jgi:hypothetical protein
LIADYYHNKVVLPATTDDHWFPKL